MTDDELDICDIFYTLTSDSKRNGQRRNDETFDDARSVKVIKVDIEIVYKSILWTPSCEKRMFFVKRSNTMLFYKKIDYSIHKAYSINL